MRFLLIGGAGFVGSHLTFRITQSGADVTVFDLPSSAGRPEAASDWRLTCRRDHLLDGAHVIEGDVRFKGRIRDAIAEADPDCIIFLAALPLVHLAEQQAEAAGRSMVHGLTNTLEAVRASKSVQRFVYVSSSMVYGHFAQDPVEESAPLAPLNLYGGLKLAGEVLVKSYLGRRKEHVIVRPSGVYGGTDIHRRVVQAFCEASLTGGRIAIEKGGTTFIDFTFIDDLVDGLFRAATLSRAANETFNLTFGQARSLDDLLAVVQRLAPGADVVRTWTLQTGRPRRGALSIRKARDLLGYDPAVTLEAGVRSYLDTLRSGDLRPQPARSRTDRGAYAALRA